MNDYDVVKDVLAVIVVIAAIGFLLAIAYWVGTFQGHDKGWRQGVIDAASGQACYRLEKQTDQTTQWVITEDCNDRE